MDNVEASRKFLRGDRSPQVCSTLKNASDAFSTVWYDFIPQRPALQARYSFAERHLKTKVHKGELLEVGSWTGSFAKNYKNLGYKVTCLDGCYSCGELVRETGVDEFIYARLDDVVITKKFDVICAFEILEHLVDPDRAVSMLKNMLNPDGLFLITVPTEHCVFDGYTANEYPGGEHIQSIPESRIRGWGFQETTKYVSGGEYDWYMASYTP